MRQLAAIMALLSTFSCPAGNAAQIDVVANFSSNNYAIYLDGGLTNGQFDVIDFRAVTGSANVFVNIDDGFDGFSPRPAGQDFTYINQLLGASRAQGGEGFTVLGATTTPTVVAFTAGPLGATIDTSTDPGGRLFLANLDLSSNFFYASIDLYSQGTIIESFRIVPIPEPASLLMMSFAAAFAVLALKSRRG